MVVCLFQSHDTTDFALFYFYIRLVLGPVFCLLGITFAVIDGIFDEGKDEVSVRSLSFTLIICFVSIIVRSVIDACLNWFTDAFENSNVARNCRKLQREYMYKQKYKSFSPDSPNRRVKDLREEIRLLQEQYQLNQRRQHQSDRCLSVSKQLETGKRTSSQYEIDIGSDCIDLSTVKYKINDNKYV